MDLVDDEVGNEFDLVCLCNVDDDGDGDGDGCRIITVSS